MEGVRERLKNQITVVGIKESSIGRVINGRHLVAILQFSNFTGILPDKFILTIRLQSILQTHNRTAYMDDHLWITRCSGYIRRSESPTLQAVDFYYRENFAQLCHAATMEWMDSLVNDYVSGIFNMDDAFLNGSFTEMPQIYTEEMADFLSMQQTLLAAKFEVTSILFPDHQRSCLTILNSCTNWFLYHLLYFIPFVHLVWVRSFIIEKLFHAFSTLPSMAIAVVWSGSGDKYNTALLDLWFPAIPI